MKAQKRMRQGEKTQQGLFVWILLGMSPPVEVRVLLPTGTGRALLTRGSYELPPAGGREEAEGLSSTCYCPKFLQLKYLIC